jgi:hypothetical protein
MNLRRLAWVSLDQLPLVASGTIRISFMLVVPCKRWDFFELGEVARKGASPPDLVRSHLSHRIQQQAWWLAEVARHLKRAFGESLSHFVLHYPAMTTVWVADDDVTQADVDHGRTPPPIPTMSRSWHWGTGLPGG